MKHLVLTLLFLALYVLHQDSWLWSVPRPLVFGVFPPGLFYHAAHTLASSALCCLLVKLAWPKGIASAKSMAELGP